MQSVQAKSKMIHQLEGFVKAMGETLCLQQEKVKDLEDWCRRNNLLVFGIAEEHNETTDKIKSKVTRNVFENQLAVTVSSIECIHRSGSKQQNKIRPIIMKFADYNKKIKVLRQCRKLKGSQITFVDDYSEITERWQRLLWESTKK